MPTKDPTYQPRLNHLILSTPPSQHPAIAAFYTAALAPLGYTILHRYGPVLGFSADAGKHADFWLAPARPRAGSPAPADADGASRGVHVAFTAQNRAQVRAFHAAARAAGGVENGPPGVRAGYHESYYAAFVLDPLGNNVEAVDHAAVEGREEGEEEMVGEEEKGGVVRGEDR